MNDALQNSVQPISPEAKGLLRGLARKQAFGVCFALMAGLLLRLWWVWKYGQVTYDSHVYGEFARSVIEHHVYGYLDADHGATVVPTLIRLPGYPAFLGLCFKIFGMENYTAVMVVQSVMDVWTCLLVAGLSARVFGQRAGIAALWLSTLCPFTANYVAVPLTEQQTLFCIALAFYALVRWKESGAGINRWLFVIGFALAYAIQLRPEQGMLAAAVVPAMIWIAIRAKGIRSAMRSATLVSVLTLLPLVPWTIRNWQVFHEFQPLVPKYAVDPGEPNPDGFQRWYRTWAVEFASTESIYWPYMGEPIDIADLPNRAFDSNAQYAATQRVFDDYNEGYESTPEVDSQFNQIALERIHADAVRYYLALPAARVVNMMFRPRTEMIAVPLEWWKFRESKSGCWFAVAYGVLNAAFFAAAGWTIWRRRLWQQENALVTAMLATIAMRALLLLTIDNSEPRYTLEFFPVLIVLASASVAYLQGLPSILKGDLSTSLFRRTLE